MNSKTLYEVKRILIADIWTEVTKFQNYDRELATKRLIDSIAAGFEIYHVSVYVGDGLGATVYILRKELHHE